MRTVTMLAVVLAVAPAAAAQQPQSSGATDWFGRGITRVRHEGTEIQLDLTTRSEGMLLRMVEGRPIEIVGVGPFEAGTSTIQIPPRPREHVRVTNGQPQNQAEAAAAEAAAIREEVHCRAAEAPQYSVNPSQARPSRGGATYSASYCGSGPQRVSMSSIDIVRAQPRQFLLLVLSDQPIDSSVTRRIALIRGFDPATAAHDLAEFLVGRRSPMWAGYLARP